VAGAQDKAAGVRLSEQAAERLDDLAIVCCFGRAVVPRNAYGRREIEGLAIVEEPPRLVGQLLLLARGLLALGLVETAVVGLCRRAALDSIPQVRRRLLHALAEDDEVSVSEAARRVGCDRRVARMGLEELAAIGLATCPALDDEDQEELGDAPGRWAAHPWRLAGPDQRLVRAVLQGRPWDEVWGACPGRGEGEGAGRGGGVGGPHTSSQGPAATLADSSPACRAAGELVCPACGQLARPAPGSAGRCPDCAVELVPVRYQSCERL
jgi:ribosomal protein S18 acetylase RimI-like enzyme